MHRPEMASDVAPFVCLVTFPSEEAARSTARALVEERLCACVNLVPNIRSIYAWKGQVSDDAEVLAIVKTTAAAFPALRERIVALHPYEVPEVVALAVADGHAEYLAWLASSVGPARSPAK